MSEKDSRDSFYFLNAYQDGITPGQKITIQHNVSYNDWRAAPHLAPLVKLTDAEINQRKEASITLEKELYAKLKQIASEWDEQAAHTMLLERALEYVHMQSCSVLCLPSATTSISWPIKPTHGARPPAMRSQRLCCWCSRRHGLFGSGSEWLIQNSSSFIVGWTGVWTIRRMKKRPLWKRCWTTP